MTRLGYRPALDGLRAVAIALVVGYHAFRWPAGGWIGVDLFFVLSGFLITTLLLEERARTGSVSLRAFYGRRTRRLVPAMVVVLGVFTVVVAAGRGLTRTDVVGATTSLGYVTNLVQGLHGPDGAGPTELRPLWSLATEEQFYLLWPVLLFVLLRGSRAAGAVLAIAVAVAISAQMVRLYESGAPEHRLVFSPDTRPVGLAVGCLAGIAWVSRPTLARAARLLAPLLLALVVAFALADPQGALYDGLLPLFVCVCALLILAVLDRDGPTSRVLALAPAVYLGRISYSLYLWHLPVIFAGDALFREARSRELRALELVAALVVAAASYHLVEQRFLRKGRMPEVATRPQEPVPAPPRPVIGSEPAPAMGTRSA